MNNIKMLYFDRIYVSQVIDVNRASASKECDSCQYWCFYVIDLSYNQMSSIDVLIC